MMDEAEIRSWRQQERSRLEAIVDFDDRRTHRIVVATLDGVLND